MAEKALSWEAGTVAASSSGVSTEPVARTWPFPGCLLGLQNWLVPRLPRVVQKPGLGYSELRFLPAHAAGRRLLTILGHFI